MTRKEIRDELEKLGDIAQGLSPATVILGRSRDRTLRILREARVLLEPAEVEIEGGGTTWFYVCEECHGVVDVRDNFCKHCGKELSWGG